MKTPLLLATLSLAVALAVLGVLLLLAVPQLSEFASQDPQGSAPHYVTAYILAGLFCLAGAFALAAICYAKAPRAR